MIVIPIVFCLDFNINVLIFPSGIFLLVVWCYFSSIIQKFQISKLLQTSYKLTHDKQKNPKQKRTLTSLTIESESSSVLKMRLKHCAQNTRSKFMLFYILLLLLLLLPKSCPFHVTSKQLNNVLSFALLQSCAAPSTVLTVNDGN